MNEEAPVTGQEQPFDADVVVVGAGPVGLTLAADLEARGARVVLAGLPADHPHDIAFRTALTGTEFARIKIPCRRDRYTATGGADSGWSTPEPAHRINQTFLEPVLAEHVAALPGVTLLNRTRYLDFSQELPGVLPGERAWSYYLVNTRRCGSVFAIDGHGTFLVHNPLNPGEAQFDSVDRDAPVRGGRAELRLLL
jgi:hypothetical protein